MCSSYDLRSRSCLQHLCSSTLLLCKTSARLLRNTSTNLL
jgi:hypothetical protein